MKIGLVTVTFNSEEVLPDFLDSVSEQTHDDFILYVVDNASVDKTLEGLKHFPKEKIRIIPNKENLGVAAGNNQGIERALADKCDYVLLINNDTLFEDQLLEKLLSVSVQEEMSMVTTKMMYFEESNKIWYGGGFLNKWKAYKHNHLGIGEYDNGQFNTPQIVSYAPTCCVLFHKSVFKDIGLMDEKYFVYFDDVDYFYRVYIQGKHKLYYYPDTRFLHKEGSITKSKNMDENREYMGDFYIKQNTKNQVYYLRKQKGVLVPFWICYEYLYVNLKFFLSGKFKMNWKTFLLIQNSFFSGFKV